MMMANISERNYEDFAPVSDFISEKECDTLLLYLPGFRKEQLKVQLTTSRILRISGERPIGDRKWRRFQKEFQVPANIDMKDMTAKFEGGILYIRQPKLITPAATEEHDQSKTAEQPAAPQSDEQEAPSEEKKDNKDEKPEEKMDSKDEKHEEKLDNKDEKHEEGKEKQKLDETRKEVVGGGNELFKKLKKPENLKRVAVYVILLLILGFNIMKMFKSFTKVEEQSVLEYDHQEL